MESILYLLFVLLFMATENSISACKLCFSKTCTGTMKSVSSSEFDPAYDAKMLRDAVEGLGTDEYSLSYILTSRSDSQRQLIIDEYAKLKHNLLDDIKTDTSGGFKKAMVALVSNLVTFYANELSRAINDKDEFVMVEILSTLTPCMIRKVSNKYNELFEKNLYNDLDTIRQFDVLNFSPSDFAAAMQSLAQGNREENIEPDHARAITDANRLKEAGVDRVGTDEAVLIEIFTQRSMPQLAETLKQYQVLREKDLFSDYHSLERDIKSEFSSSALKELYITIAKNAIDQPLYFASEIQKVLQTFNKLGKDEYKLVRIIRGRGDIDMEEIKIAYQKEFKKSLAEGITDSFGKTDFSKALLAMLNEPHD